MPRIENITGYVHSTFLSIEGEGNMVGVRSLFVRLAGCNINCPYCDTDYAREESPAKLTIALPNNDIMLDNPIHAGDLITYLTSYIQPAPRYLCITGGEPLLQPDFTTAIAELAHHKLQLVSVLETSGLFPDKLEPLTSNFSLINMDIKLPSLMEGVEHWERHKRSLLIASSSMVQVKAVVAQNTSDTEIERTAKMIAEVESYIPFIIQPVAEGHGFDTPTGEQLLHWQGMALMHLHEVRVIPQIHKILRLP